MNRTRERMRRRREYLKQKGKAYSVISTLSLFACFLALSMIGCVVLAIGFLGNAFNLIPLHAILASAACLGAAAAFRFVLRGLQRDVDRLNRDLAAKYIPPVTPDSLPAEEVLVRGSEEPQPPQSEVLVRPAIQEQETPAEQLLRSSQGGSQG